MKDSERDALFAHARRAATPTDDDRRRVRAALNRKLRVTAAAAMSATAATSAASAVPAGGVAGAAVSTLAVMKVVVAVAAFSAVLIHTAPVPSGARQTERDAAGVAASTLPPAARRVATREHGPSPSGGVGSARTPTEPATTLSTTFLPPAPRASEPARVVPAPGSSPAAVIAETRAPAPVEVAVPAPSEARPDTAAEIALAARIQAALRDGDTQGTLALVEEHERLFPASVWAPERDGARVLALCMGADPLEARKLGLGFLEKHSRSPLGGRVRATCGLTSDPR